MKVKTKILSLIFGTTIATSAIIAPTIILSSCSNGDDSGSGNGNNNQNGNGNGNNNQGGNGNNNQNGNGNGNNNQNVVGNNDVNSPNFDPDKVDFTSVPNITELPIENVPSCTYQEADAKLTQRFQQATLDRLNYDLFQYSKVCKNPQEIPGEKNEFYFKAEKGKKPNTINLIVKWILKKPNSNNSGSENCYEQSFVFYDFFVKPVIYKEGTSYKAGWCIPNFNSNVYYSRWSIGYERDHSQEPDNIGFPGQFGGFFKKQDLINDVKKKYSQKPEAFDPQNDGYFLQRSIIKENSSYSLQTAYALIIIKNINQKLKILDSAKCYRSIIPAISMNMTFSDITDAASNMQKEQPIFDYPTFPK